MRTIGCGIETRADIYAISSTTMSEAPEFIRVKRRRDEDSVQALRMCWLTGKLFIHVVGHRTNKSNQ